MQIQKRILPVLLLSIFLWNKKAVGQDSTAHNSVQKKKFYYSLIAPTTLIGTGLIIKGNDDGLNQKIRDKRNENFPSFHTHADDYLQYVPIVAVYSLNLSGVKGKNNYGNSLALLIKSELLMTAIVQPIKRTSHVTRPDGSADNSFPSGHTAQAFVAATFLHKEFGEKSIWYSVGAYSCATAVGALRILNNRHWLSDVLVGAGIGIFSTHLVYYTHRYKWSKKTGRALLMPTYSTGPGLYFSYKFK